LSGVEDEAMFSCAGPNPKLIFVPRSGAKERRHNTKRKEREKTEKRKMNEGLWNESKHTTRKNPGQDTSAANSGT